MIAIARPLDWFAGFWAGCLFLLVHGRDGILELGQRDLTLTACLLAAYAFLFLALRREIPWPALMFGLLAGLAGTIKPTMLFVGPASLIVATVDLRRESRPSLQFALYGAVGWLLPWSAAILFLSRNHAVAAFMTTTRGMLLYHASLARQTLGYLLLHSISPLMPLVAIWLAVVILLRGSANGERRHLWVGLGFGLLSYVAQAKGYSYQRYPFLGFLLLLIAMDFVTGLKVPGLARALSIAGLAVGALVIAPISTAMASHYDWRNLGTVGMLEEDLGSLGAQRLSGGVQCVDSIAGCTNALYRMKLTEPSYVFYDEFLFGPASVAAVEQNREKFWHDIVRAPPAVMIVTERLFPSGPDDYRKLSLWPQFSQYLSQNYTLYLQRTPNHPVRWWSRTEVPAGYRIYLRKGVAALPD